MNKKSILKVGIVVLIIGMIFMQIYRIEASSFQQLIGANEISGANEIRGENGESSSLNTASANNATLNTTNTTNTTNTLNTTNTANNTPKVNNTANTNRNTALPQTGTNENIIIGLMVVFAIVGVYTFKKIRDYNI